MLIKDAIIWSNKKLNRNEVDNASSSTNLLLSDLLEVNRAYLVSHPERELSKSEEKRYRSWVERRSKHEPVWYITGHIDFMNHSFIVNKNVLVPRPETEILIEKFISANGQQITSESRILEIGTGSGAIIVSLEKNLDGQYFASDISSEALKVAKENAERIIKRTTILFKKGNLFEPWKNKKFDYILVNLPYIPHQQMTKLSPDILDFEPKIALDGGINGLDIYNKFLSNASKHLSENGKIYGEIGDKQGAKISELSKKYLPDKKVEVIKDYANLDRIFIIQNY
ncbi:MAG: peptide chain release factor N(5)-glutamine methyltransferase [bacterium]